MARLTLLPLVLLVAACGSATYARNEFGLRPLQRELFPALDSALAGQSGQRVMVHAQDDLGQQGPVRQSRISFFRFEGRLLGVDRSWVSLLRGSDDTLRVSKGHITAIWLARSASTEESTLLGAGVLGLVALGILQAREPADGPSTETRFGIVAGSAVLGGLLGRALFGGSRRGTQLYPRPDE